MRTHARCTIPPGAAIPDAFERVTLPSLRMAVLTLKGSFDQNPKGWDNLYGSWLPVSGEEPRAEPAFERYLNDMSDTRP